ncbi:unnamed protein product, partial [Timema podura]|nr:unnamed protein product [Timema podura]
MKCLSGEQQPDRRASKELDRKIREWSLSFNKAIKLLLLGTGESGKTTIIKQMKILHITGFSDSERLEKASEIRQNVHESIYDIVRHMPHLTPPIEVDDEQSEESVAYILALGEEVPQHFTDVS